MIESQDKIYQLISEIESARTIAARAVIAKELHSQFTYIVGELNHLKTEVEFWQDL